MKRLYLIILIGFTWYLLGCRATVHYSQGVVEKKETRYIVSPPQSPEWKQLKVRDADVSWYHQKTNASILVNSSCGVTTNASAQALAGHLLLGMTEQKVLERKNIEVAGRQAYYQVVQAYLDGVILKLASVTLRKNSCVYDIVLTAPPETFLADLFVLQEMIKSFDSKELM